MPHWSQYVFFHTLVMYPSVNSLGSKKILLTDEYILRLQCKPTLTFQGPIQEMLILQGGSLCGKLLLHPNNSFIFNHSLCSHSFTCSCWYNVHIKSYEGGDFKEPKNQVRKHEYLFFFFWHKLKIQLQKEWGNMNIKWRAFDIWRREKANSWTPTNKANES